MKQGGSEWDATIVMVKSGKYVLANFTPSHYSKKIIGGTPKIGHLFAKFSISKAKNVLFR